MKHIAIASLFAGAGLLMSLSAIAQSKSDTSVSPTAPAAADQQAPDPGSRDCLRETGSHILPKDGGCLTMVHGRSLSSEELETSGVPALSQGLARDPSITMQGN